MGVPVFVNGLEAGEGEMNALYAGFFGVPVILASKRLQQVPGLPEEVRQVVEAGIRA